MSALIEDYAIIGDTETAALVSKFGCIDWLCLPRFDSSACFSSLLGDAKHGHWTIAPTEEITKVERSYRGDTLILETTMTTATGVVKLIDFMPPRGRRPDVVRIVEGISGTVSMRMDLVARFDYGLTVPWARRTKGDLVFLAGPDGLILHTSVPTRGRNLTTVAEFEIKEGDQEPFIITWFPSHEPAPAAIDPFDALQETEEMWNEWSAHCTYEGEYRTSVMRSLLTLKALTYAPTGGIVAAATTSLPEAIGGERNWDYRYCWLRDATFTLYAFMSSGYKEEASSWRDWLLRAIAGKADQMQIMYGVAGERQLNEFEVDWLPGYEDSKPVRIGNEAAGQFQIDVYGEVMDALHQARKVGIAPDKKAWSIQRGLLTFLEKRWQDPDDGIWEVRGGRQHFTHSKVMAWVAFDRGVKAVERYDVEGPVEKWRKIRDQIHDDVHKNGWNEKKQAFTQFYGSDELDASVLMMSLVGFIHASDPRMMSTIQAIEDELVVDGFVNRYNTNSESNAVDGLKGKEGAFLPCTFWLVDNLALSGRVDRAKEIFEGLLGLANDLGLLAEEYDTDRKRQIGNFPQAFTHVALVNSAMNLGKNVQTEKFIP